MTPTEREPGSDDEGGQQLVEREEAAPANPFATSPIVAAPT
jgi:hypothetical protein